MKSIMSIAAVLALSGAAFANDSEIAPAQLRLLAGAPSIPPISDRIGTRIDISFNNAVNSVDEEGDADNVVGIVDLNVPLNPGETLVITGIGWNVNLTAFAPSVLDDMAVGFGATSGGSVIGLFPGAGVFQSGTASFASPILKLADFGFPAIALVGDDLRLEFYEFIDDNADLPDGFWAAGSVLSVQYQIVPTPGAAALFAAAGLVGLRRRR
jgi:hypothetical protein